MALLAYLETKLLALNGANPKLPNIYRHGPADNQYLPIYPRPGSPDGSSEESEKNDAPPPSTAAPPCECPMGNVLSDSRYELKPTSPVQRPRYRCPSGDTTMCKPSLRVMSNKITIVDSLLPC